MPNWKEQVLDIRQLREARRQADEALYAVQVRLHQAVKQSEKLQKQETQPPANTEVITGLKTRIAAEENRLRTLAGELQALSALARKQMEIEQQLAFIEKQLQTVSAGVVDMDRIVDEQNQNPTLSPDDLQKLSNNRKTLLDLKQSLEAEQQQTADGQAKLRHQQNQAPAANDLQAETLAVRKNLADLQEQLSAVLTHTALNSAQTQVNATQLVNQETAAKNQLLQTQRDLQQAIIGLYQDPHPRSVVNQMPDDTPFLLLPIRIETRFMQSKEGNELWLRVYPDDIAIHTHESLLTPQEVEEGKKYWQALWDARKVAGADEENKKAAAWSTLATLYGPQRAAWIAKQSKPVNWDVGEGDPNFPAHDLTKPAAWSRAPRTHIMPDKFVVMLYTGDTLVKEVIGHPIPDELLVGPDPMDAEASFPTQDGKLVFGASFDWMSDFPKSIAMGMGFRIPLTPLQAREGFSKVLVLGLLLSGDESDGQQTLEALIDNHHYSPKGFSLLRQGTPTNNTDDHGSGYTRNDAFNNGSYFVETGEPLFKVGDDTDGRLLADALGIDYQSLQYIRNSDATDYREAVAMNTALYPGTLGYYFSTLLSPVLSEQSQDSLRDFFITNVTGRGALPALRVGNQPYGVLLTSDFSRWQWSRAEAVAEHGFLPTLQTVLAKYQTIWLSLLGQLKHVGLARTQGNPDDILMDILGLQAGSTRFGQRNAYSTDYLRNLDSFKYGGRYFADMQRQFTSKNLALDFLSSLGYTEKDASGFLKVPQLLRLVYQHFQTTLDAANLIDPVPLSERDAIRYFDEAAQKNYLHWLADTTSITNLEQQDFGANRSAPTTLLYLMLRRSLLLQLHSASVFWFLRNGVDLTSTSKAKNFLYIRPENDLSKWETMKAKIAVAVSTHPDSHKTIADYLLTTGKSQTEADFLNQQRNALKTLAALPTARLERCFTEHLDVCTYRLDSWQTAMFGVRLQEQRQSIRGFNQENRRQGIYLGAYGWVEDLRPSAKRQVTDQDVPEALKPAKGQPLYEYSDNGGFVHAPSLNQAQAAAVLRSGYLSHAHSGQPDNFAVNLSSERIRRALFILEGLRNGQTLEAVLGYQFERGLHDAASADPTLLKLNLYIYDFRSRFPLEKHLLKQQGNEGAVETIPPNAVVNGVKLAEASGDVPFGATGAVLAATAGEKQAIRRVKDQLADSLDAVQDLLQSEAVYQLVQGNFDRAGAVANALKDANIPPEIDIINTPRSCRFSFTQRVCLHFAVLDPADAASNPWPLIPMTARAMLEPGLNAWLGKVLGQADEIFIRVSHLDDHGLELGYRELALSILSIQPIDLIYLTGQILNTGSDTGQSGASELELRIGWLYRQLESLDDNARLRIEFLRPESKKNLGGLLPLLRNLKSLVTDSRPLHALDYDPPSKKSLADKANPEAYDAAELLSRVAFLRTTHATLFETILALSLDADVKDKDGNSQHYFKLETAFDALAKANLGFTQISFVFADSNAQILQDTLISVADMGLADAFPKHQTLDQTTKATLLDQAMITARRMKSSADEALALLNQAQAASKTADAVALAIKAGKALLGDVFNILPRFAYNNAADIQLADADQGQLLKYARDQLQMPHPLEEWLQGVAQVRPNIARLDQVLSIYEAFNDDILALQTLQLPYRDKDSWLAVGLPDKDPLDPSKPFDIVHDTLSVTHHGQAALSPSAAQCGLLIDDWTEIIPTRTETTGIAFNIDQPNAAPPQALLLAVPPQIKGHWDWDSLVGILNDTLLRAKLRAVEPDLLDKVDKAETGVLLPAILADFSQFDLNVALDYRININFVEATRPIQVILPSVNP